MKNLFRWIALSAFLACGTLSAQDGRAYADSQRSPAIAPALALGTIAAVGVIAVLVQNRSHGNHSHSGNQSSGS